MRLPCVCVFVCVCAAALLHDTGRETLARELRDAMYGKRGKILPLHVFEVLKISKEK